MKKIVFCSFGLAAAAVIALAPNLTLSSSDSGDTKATTAVNESPSAVSASTPACSLRQSSATKTTSLDTLCANKGAYKGKCAALTLSITGMKGKNSAAKVIRALKSDKGIIKVISADYKTGRAIACYDPDKTEPNKLAALVTKTGYKTEIVSVSPNGPTTDSTGTTCDIITKKCETKPETEGKTH
ncbi:MAG: heavy metal-associated domain-containing protein [candidate division Zixibacteria bacterium]|nr:heavy metal-associated domain-containing protein [candidate division Zixibacteria bacterium]